MSPDWLWLPKMNDLLGHQIRHPVVLQQSRSAPLCIKLLSWRDAEDRRSPGAEANTSKNSTKNTLQRLVCWLLLYYSQYTDLEKLQTEEHNILQNKLHTLLPLSLFLKSEHVFWWGPGRNAQSLQFFGLKETLPWTYMKTYWSNSTRLENTKILIPMPEKHICSNLG